jgi:hypothetical protein
VAQGQRQGLSDAHQSHFAERDGEPPRAPVAIRNSSAEEDRPTTRQPQASVMFRKGSLCDANFHSILVFACGHRRHRRNLPPAISPYVIVRLLFRRSELPNPPLHLSRSISFSGITSGGSASANGGGLFTKPMRGKNVIARIDGDTDGVFSIVEIQTLGLVHDPDAPPKAGSSWEPVETVTGPGPIEIAAGLGALAVTVSFSVGLSPSNTSYSASVSIVEAGTSVPILFSIPLTASVLLIPPGIAGGIKWDLELYYPAGLPKSEWGSLLKITLNTIDPGRPFEPSYTQVASGGITGLTNDFTEAYATYSISIGPGVPYDQPLVILIYDELFRVSPPWQGFNQMQTSGPNPVILTNAQPGVLVDFELYGLQVR